MLNVSHLAVFPMRSGIYSQLVIRPFRRLSETMPRVVFSKTRQVSMIARKFATEMMAVMAVLIANSHSMLKRVCAGSSLHRPISQRPWKLTTTT